MKTVLILCAGSQKRFAGTVPKQLMLFNNNPLLQRAIEQVKHYGYKPYIITRNSQIINFCNKQDVYLFYPNNNSKCVNTLLSTKLLWNGKVIVLLGDVYYNQKCLDMTFDHNKNIGFFGNAEEIFSIVFKSTTKVTDALYKASQHRLGKLWHFYRVYCDIPLDNHKRDTQELYYLPSDNTMDIDTYEEYLQLKNEIENLTTQQNML